MAYETRPNTGSLFSNKDKPDRKENGPDYSGTAQVEGVDCFMDAWVKTTADGKKWMSFSFKPKQKQPAPQSPRAVSPAQPAKASGGFADMDSDIPF